MSNTTVVKAPSIDYHAPWPKALAPIVNNNDSVISQIFMAAVYIPVSIASWVKGKLQTLTGYLICPAILRTSKLFEMFRFNFNCNPDFEQTFDLAGRRNELKTFYKGKELNLNSPNGDTINAMHFPGKVKKAIVYATGNTAFYEYASSNAVLNMRKAMGENINLMVLNPPEVVESRALGPLTEEGFALSVYSACKYLIDTQGIDPNDIVIWGLSLGGGYGAKAAALLQQDYPEKKINAFIENSFSSLPAAIDWLVPNAMLPIPFLGTILGKIASVIAWALDYNFDSLENLRTLKGKVAITYNNSDLVMGDACLKKWIKKTNSTAEKPLTGMQIKLLETRYGDGELRLEGNSHCRPLYAPEEYEIVQQLRDMLGFPSNAPLNPKIRRPFRTAPKQAIPDTNTVHLNQIKSHFSVLDRLLAIIDDETVSHFDPRDYVCEYMKTLNKSNYTFGSEEKTLFARFDELRSVYQKKSINDGGVRIVDNLTVLTWTLHRLKMELALCYLAVSDLTDLKKIFGSLEQAHFAPKDQIPGLPTNYAHALFKCLYDVYEVKRTEDKTLPPANGDFGRESFLNPHFNPSLKRDAIQRFKSLTKLA